MPSPHDLRPSLLLIFCFGVVLIALFATSADAFQIPSSPLQQQLNRLHRQLLTASSPAATSQTAAALLQLFQRAPWLCQTRTVQAHARSWRTLLFQKQRAISSRDKILRLLFFVSAHAPMKACTPAPTTHASPDAWGWFSKLFGASLKYVPKASAAALQWALQTTEKPLRVLALQSVLTHTKSLIAHKPIRQQLKARLKRLYQRTTGQTQWLAARCLGTYLKETGDRALLSFLRKKLLSPSSALRKGAAYALALAGQPAQPPLLSWLTERDRKRALAAAYALSQMKQLSAAAISTSLRILQHSRYLPLQRYLLLALGQLRRPSTQVQRVLAHFAQRGRSRALRAQALLALQKAPGPWLLKTLRSQYKSRSWRTRKAALIALQAYRRTPRKRALLPFLRHALRDPHVRVRATAVRVTGLLVLTPFLPTLTALLRHRSWRLRYAAAEALQRMGIAARPATSALVWALADRNWGVRYEAAQALGKIGIAILPHLQRAWRGADFRQRLGIMAALERLRHQRTKGLTLLQRGLRDPHPQVRYAAAHAISTLKAQALPAKHTIIYALQDRDWKVRKLLLQSLRTFPVTPVIERVLIHRLRDPHPANREASADALRPSSSNQATAALLRCATTDRHLQVRLTCLHSLSQRKLSLDQQKHLQDALPSAPPDVQIAIILLLHTSSFRLSPSRHSTSQPRQLAFWLTAAQKPSPPPNLALRSKLLLQLHRGSILKRRQMLQALRQVLELWYPTTAQQCRVQRLLKPHLERLRFAHSPQLRTLACRIQRNFFSKNTTPHKRCDNPTHNPNTTRRAP